MATTSDDYRLRIERAVREWEALPEAPADAESPFDLTKTVTAGETPTVPWPKVRPLDDQPTDAVPLPLADESAVNYETLGRLLAGVTHDFNNVLAAVVASGDLLAEKILPHGAPGHEYVEVIRTAGRHATGLTRRLLALARPTAGVPRPIDASKVVTDLRPLMRAVIAGDVRLRINVAADLPLIAVDPTQIEQVVLNLVANAAMAMAMARGGDIRVRTAGLRREGRTWVCLTVADTGTGMDAATKARAFDAFFTTSPTGNGLGLANVRELVVASGGTIELDSEPGRGSVFRIRWPAVPRPSAVDGTGLSALVADDDPAVCEVVQRILESAGFDVAVANGGPEALRLTQLLRGPIDLLVTDIVMPGLGGRRLADVVRTKRLGTAVVYISGYPSAETQMPPGVTFLPKPFGRKHLLTAVAKVLPSAVIGGS